MGGRNQSESVAGLARNTQLTEDTVKKRFIRAYELTQGREYNIEKKRELWIIYKSELKNECGTCEIREKCTDPCPDILFFIDQDHIGPTYSNRLRPEIMELIIDPKKEKREGEEGEEEEEYSFEFGFVDDAEILEPETGENNILKGARLKVILLHRMKQNINQKMSSRGWK